MTNPFLTKKTAPHETFPFEQLKNEHYLSYKKLYNFISALDKNTEVIFIYHHPRVDHYNNKLFFRVS